MSAFPNLFAALVLEGLVGFFVHAAVPAVTYPVFKNVLESEICGPGVTPKKQYISLRPSRDGCGSAISKILLAEPGFLIY
jgi:hypothetical protein